MRKQYEDAGMSIEVIQAMYEYPAGSKGRKRYGQHRQSEIQRQYPGYSGAAECPPVCHQAAGYYRPVHLRKSQDRLALQPHAFPGCIP